jgi:hypothetical protein
MAFANSSIDEFNNPFDRGVIFGTGWGGLDDTKVGGTAFPPSLLRSS